jgi:O-antigen/teichoic acid export membrane protein
LAIYAGAEGRLWRPIAIVTLVNLGSNALAVPFFGANGAAAAVVLSEVVALVLYRRMFSSVLALRPSAFSLVPPLASVALVASGWAAAHWAAGVGAGVGVLMLPRAAVLGACYLVCLQALGTARRRRSLAQRLAGSERT